LTVRSTCHRSKAAWLPALFYARRQRLHRDAPSVVTSASAPDEEACVQSALTPTTACLYAVTDATGEVLAATSYHDIVPSVKRVEICHRYAQRTVNTANRCRTHAFEMLSCHVVLAHRQL
jgi:hypothetical protein